MLFPSEVVQAESVLMHRVLLLAQNVRVINQNYYFSISLHENIFVLFGVFYLEWLVVKIVSV